MISVNLFVKDTKVAIEFYKKAFNAVLVSYQGDELGTQVACIAIGDDIIMLADENVAYGNKSAISLGGVPMCIALYSECVEDTMRAMLSAGAKPEMPSTVDNLVHTMDNGQEFGNMIDPFGFVWSVVKNDKIKNNQATLNTESNNKGGKTEHKWSKTVAEIDFFVNYNGAKAVCRWQKRDEMLIKKGATIKLDIPLNKDGSVGFSAKFALQLREMQKDKITNHTTTQDIVLKSVNEVGSFLYFAGVNSWLVLKDKNDKTIEEWTAK